MTYKNNIIGFLVLSVLWVSLSIYFSSEIQKDELNFIKQKELVSKYNNFKKRYSKQTLEKEKKKILEFLDVFDVKYEYKKGNMIDMELKKSNANKVISYILNSNLLFKDMQIKKIDDYTLSFYVKF